MGSQLLEEVAQRSGGFPVPREIQGEDEAPSTLIQLQMLMFITGELDSMTFEGPFDSKAKILPCKNHTEERS